MNTGLPSFNIFIISQVPEMEEKKEKKSKEGLLAKALKKKDNSGNMLKRLTKITEQLKGLPQSSAVGGIALMVFRMM